MVSTYLVILVYLLKLLLVDELEDGDGLARLQALFQDAFLCTMFFR